MRPAPTFFWETLRTLMPVVSIYQRTISREQVNRKRSAYNLEPLQLPSLVVEAQVTQTKFPFLGKVGLSASHVELGANSMSSPIYTTDSTVQIIYVVKGSGQIQIVGINGKRVLDTQVKVGHLVVVVTLGRCHVMTFTSSTRDC